MLTECPWWANDGKPAARRHGEAMQTCEWKVAPWWRGWRCAAAVGDASPSDSSLEYSRNPPLRSGRWWRWWWWLALKWCWWPVRLGNEIDAAIGVGNVAGVAASLTVAAVVVAGMVVRNFAPSLVLGTSDRGPGLWNELELTAVNAEKRVSQPRDHDPPNWDKGDGGGGGGGGRIGDGGVDTSTASALAGSSQTISYLFLYQIRLRERILCLRLSSDGFFLAVLHFVHHQEEQLQTFLLRNLPFCPPCFST